MTPTVIILLGAGILFFWVVWTGNDPVIELKKLLGQQAPAPNVTGQPNTTTGGNGINTRTAS